MRVNNFPRVALGSAAAGIRTRELLKVRLPNHSAIEPQVGVDRAPKKFRDAGTRVSGVESVADR